MSRFHWFGIVAALFMLGAPALAQSPASIGSAANEYRGTIESVVDLSASQGGGATLFRPEANAGPQCAYIVRFSTGERKQIAQAGEPAFEVGDSVKILAMSSGWIIQPVDESD